MCPVFSFPFPVEVTALTQVFVTYQGHYLWLQILLFVINSWQLNSDINIDVL